MSTTRGGTLRGVLESYLLSKGFFRHEIDGREYWGHHNLGQGRTFTGAVAWQMGREDGLAVGGDENASVFSGWEENGRGFPVIDPRARGGAA